MELRQLRYFIAIARYGSFSMAAQRIRVAQPALSAQIGNLEKEIGCPLFSRHARGVRLTHAGEQLVDHASAILNRVDEALLALRASAPKDHIEITLGVPPLISMMLTVPLLEAIARDHPNVSIRIVEQMTGALHDWLANNTIDLAFLHNVDRNEYPDAVPIVRESLYAAASENSGVKLQSELHARDLVKLPLIASRPKNNHRMLLEKISQLYQSPLTLVAEVDSIPRQRELIYRGKGVLVLTLAGYSDWPKCGIQFARIHGKGVAWETSLVAGGTPAGKQAMTTLAPLILSLAQSLVQAGQWPGVEDDFMNDPTLSMNDAPHSESKQGP